MPCVRPSTIACRTARRSPSRPTVAPSSRRRAQTEAARTRSPPPRAAAGTAPRLRPRGRCKGRTRGGSGNDEPLQLGDSRRADPGDGVELVDRAERPVRLPVVDDLLGGRRPDAGERVELLDGGCVQVERRGPPTGAAAGGGGGAAKGPDDL